MFIIIIVPTVCASGDYDNQLPSSAASTAAAAVVHMLCPSLIQRAATIVAKLKANSKTSDEAADLMEKVGACVGKYLVDGESGNRILKKLISDSGEGDGPIDEIDILSPSKNPASSSTSTASSLASPTAPMDDLYCSDDDDEANIINWFDYHSDDDSSYAPSVNEVEVDIDDYVDDVTDDDSSSDDVDTENGSSVSTATAVTEPITKASAETSQPIPKIKGRPKKRGGRGRKKSNPSVSYLRKGSKQGAVIASSAPRKRKSKCAKGRKKSKRAKFELDIVDITVDRKLDLVEQRLLISHFFTHVLDAPPKSEWYGDDGTIPLIMEELSISRGNYNKVERVITQTWNCLQSNRRYLGKIN